MKTTHLKLGLLASAIAVCGTLMSVSAPVQSSALLVAGYTLSTGCSYIGPVDCVIQPSGTICTLGGGATIYQSQCFATLKRPIGGEVSH